MEYPVCVNSLVLGFVLPVIFSTAALAQWLPDNGSGIPYVPEKSSDGSMYQFRFLSTVGVNYYIQSSEDLNTWTDDVFYRGIGNTITHPLFPIPENNGGNPPVVDPEDYVPLIGGFLRIREINTGGNTTGLLVEWVSLDDDTPKSYVLHGKQIDDGMPPLFYSRNFDEYALFIQFMGEITSLNDVPPNDSLGTKDSALIGKLVDSLPTINAEITANTASQAASPPPAPMAGGKKFYRIRRFYTDSDLDGLQDHVEAQQGLNMWNWDSDGDGLSDSQDQNPLVNDAVADPDGSGLAVSLDTGLLARYDFEVLGGGSFTDKSGNNRHATANGNAAVDSLGMVSKAAKLGGSGYLSSASMLDNLTDHSQSMWICPEEDSIQNSNGIYRAVYATTAISSGVSQSRFLGVRKFNGNEIWLLGDYRWDYNNGSPTSSFSGLSWTMPLGSSDSGKWHHFVAVQTGGTAKVYVDGLEVASGTLAAIPQPASINAMTNFITGRMLPAGAANQFEGKIDRMRIYGRALSAAEVTLLHNQDIDNDGLFDRSEVKSLLWRDTNGDGIRTNAESSYLINPFRHDPASSDHDGDGLTSLLEQNNHGTDMTNPDSDGDLIPDGWEANNGLSPTNPGDANGDADNDSVTNINEYVYKTNPQLADTDGDNTNDNVEIAQGSNPHDASDNGNPIPAEEKLTIKIGVGDKSGSESEDYVMNIFRLNPETGAEEPFYTLRSGGHGQYKEETHSFFKKSESYTFQIDWQSSNLGSSGDTNNPEGADYDYTIIVEPQNDDSGILIDQYDPRIKRADTAKPIGGDKNDVDKFLQVVERKRILRLALSVVTTKEPHGGLFTPQRVDNLIAAWQEDRVKLILKGQGFKTPELRKLVQPLWNIGGGLLPAVRDDVFVNLRGFDPLSSPVKATVQVGSLKFNVYIDIPNVGSHGEGFIAATNPLAAVSVLDSANKAIEWAETFADKYKSNALQHAYWNAHVASSNDASLALLFSTAHEYSNKEEGGVAIDSTMDLHNNFVGSGVIKRFPGTFLPDESAIKQDLLNKFQQGKLYIIDPGDSFQVIKSNNEKILPN